MALESLEGHATHRAGRGIDRGGRVVRDEKGSDTQGCANALAKIGRRRAATTYDTNMLEVVAVD
jgi:hypothetical protein